ncbi:DUF3566 domain-containing protein [Actinobaculum suis]|uniref:DUF3566 domain-containing protein n=1 Tax=Actinobaculum suis TaxID=1657 RepID=UPI000A99CB0C|nr:DUF3566 domain-containing protein [Actinobaculum suis]
MSEHTRQGKTPPPSVPPQRGNGKTAAAPARVSVTARTPVADQNTPATPGVVPAGARQHGAGGQGQARPAGRGRGNGRGRNQPDARPAQTVGIRRIRMTISKIEPLSAMKLGFLLSFAFGIVLIIAMALVWLVLDGMHVWSSLNDFLLTLNSKELLQFAQYLEFGRWMSFAVIIAIIDIALLTALSAIGALIYNLCAALVGGLRLTVTDE